MQVLNYKCSCITSYHFLIQYCIYYLLLEVCSYRYSEIAGKGFDTNRRNDYTAVFHSSNPKFYTAGYKVAITNYNKSFMKYVFECKLIIVLLEGLKSVSTLILTTE